MDVNTTKSALDVLASRAIVFQGSDFRETEATGDSRLETHSAAWEPRESLAAIIASHATS